MTPAEEVSETPTTRVAANGRLELLRKLAFYREQLMPMLAAKYPGVWHDFPPLGVGYLDPSSACGTPDAELYANPWGDIVLAARECEAIGQIEIRGRGASNQDRLLNGPGWWGVRITDAGLDWIHAHDALGELHQGPTP